MAAISTQNHDDPLNHYARNIIVKSHDKIRKKYVVIPAGLAPASEQGQGLLAMPELSQGPPLAVPEEATKVGIIGAGIGGLYAAMLLQEQGIEYEIHEASPRLGGRLYTHKMGDRPNDYYDVGAMRFPNTEVMKPVFDLFTTLELELGDYRFKDEHANSTLLYNNINKQRTDKPVTPQDFEITGVVSEPWGKLGWKKNVDNVIEPFEQRLIKDFRTGGNKGWELMKRYDKYSMKAYMAGNRSDTQDFLDEANLMPYPMNVVNWCETFDKSSGWYDRALTETVLESLAFSWDGKPIDWKYIVGGSSQLAIRLDQYMSKKDGYVRPFYNTCVTGISTVTADEAPPPYSQVVEAAKNFTASPTRSGDELPPVKYVAVHLADGRTKHYSHVITTTTLPCLRTMNLSGARLDWKQKEAIRILQYGPSTKIGVRFRLRWWEDDEWMKKAGAYGAIIGGQSYTDNMSRTVVYPSYGVGEPNNGATMIVSYAWTNDALALSALMGTESRDVLKQRILQDLVEVHRFNPKAAKELELMWEDMHAWSWTNNPYTMGAFAFFGPGDFKDVYPAMTRPAAGGRLHFAGEVCSVRHAWVLGALEASNRAVDTILRCSYDAEQAETFENAYGIPEGWTKELLKFQRALGVSGTVGEFPPELQ